MHNHETFPQENRTKPALQHGTCTASSHRDWIGHLCRQISPKEQVFYLFGTSTNSTSPLSLSPTHFFILLGFSPSSASCKASLLLPYTVEMICKQKSWRLLQKEQLPKAAREGFGGTDRHNLSDSLQVVLKRFACKSRVFQLNLTRNKVILPEETQKMWQMWRRGGHGVFSLGSHVLPLGIPSRCCSLAKPLNVAFNA